MLTRVLLLSCIYFGTKFDPFISQFRVNENLLLKASGRAKENLKVFIYPSLPLPIKKNHACTMHFQAEREIPKLLKSTVSVTDPQFADFFLIDHDLTCCLTSKSAKRSRKLSFSIIDAYLKDTILTVVKSYPYFNISSGRDHLMVFTIDKGRCHFLASAIPIRRWWFRYFDNIIFLGNFGYSGHSIFYQPIRHKDDCWKNNSRGIIDASFCNRGGGLQDIVIPQYHEWLPTMSTLQFKKGISLYFRGSVKCGGVSSFQTRPFLSNFSLTPQSNYLRFIFNSGDKNSKLSSLFNINDAFFAVCPGGSAPWSVRMYDAIFHLSIPVILADSIIVPYERYLDWTKFTVKLQSQYLSNKNISMFEYMFEKSIEYQLYNIDYERSERYSKFKNTYVYKKIEALHAVSRWLSWRISKVRGVDLIDSGAFSLLLLELWCRRRAFNIKEELYRWNDQDALICDRDTAVVANISYW